MSQMRPHGLLRSCRAAAAGVLLLLLLLAIAGASAAVAQTPRGGAGVLVVLNKRAATASLLDAASGAAVATLPTGVGPHEVAISPDGRLAVVADYEGPAGAGGGSTLTVLDLRARAVARTIPLGEY